MTADLLMLSALLAGWLYVLRPPLTWGQINYRYVYLPSPGWFFTKILRKGTKCVRCERRGWLDLHHVEYRWHNRHKVIRYFVPNMTDKMKTLCRPCHMAEHRR